MLCLAVLAACASETQTDPLPAQTQPARLAVVAFPAAEVSLDGKLVGTTPVAGLEVTPGKHAVTLRRDGFEDLVLDVDLAEGEERRLDEKLKAKDAADPAIVAVLAKELGIELTEPAPKEQYRGGSKQKAVIALYPRRDVRRYDLDQYRIDVTSDFKPGGTVQFRLGKKVLHEAPFEPEEFETVQPMPAAVVSAVKEGKTVTWGYYPKKGRPVTATFAVVKEDPRLVRRLQQVEEKLEGQDPLLLGQMQAQMLLNKRLYYAAFRKARWVAERAEWPPPHAYSIMQAALRQMKLHKTRLWMEADGPSKGRRSPYRAGLGAARR